MEKNGAIRISNEIADGILYLSGCAIKGEIPEKSRLTALDLEKLFRLSKFHSIQSMIYIALEAAYGKELPNTQLMQQWKEQRDKTIRNGILMEIERSRLFAWMEEKGIWYMPLKGLLLRELYPRAEMRQMSDNDILFDQAWRKQIRDWFIAQGYEVECYGKDHHDVYNKPPVMEFEMHISLFSVHHAFDWHPFFENIERLLQPAEDGKFARKLGIEDFYIYFIAHEYKHYCIGGTGLRSLFDRYLYVQKYGAQMDWDYVTSSLAKVELDGYEKQSRELIQAVMEDPEHFSITSLPKEQQEALWFYVSSGTYGTAERARRNKLLRMQGSDGKLTRWTKLRFLYRLLIPTKQEMLLWCEVIAPFFCRHPSLMFIARIYRLWSKGIMKIGKHTKAAKDIWDAQ